MGYSSDGNNSRTIIIPHCNSYLSFYDLETLVFEEILNCNNYAPSDNPQNLNLISRANEESQIPSSEDNIFARLSKSDFYLSSHNLQSSNLNCNNYLPFRNLQSPNLKSRSNGRAKFRFQKMISLLDFLFRIY